MKKKISNILYALQDFVSRDYTLRNIAAIKFDLNRQTIEVTDGHAAVILLTSKGLIAALANEYAEYLGLDPVGGDFGVVKLAPKNGVKYPPERLPDEENARPNLYRVFSWDRQDPEMNKWSLVHKDQIKRLNKLCKALKVELKLIPGASRIGPLFQYGKATYQGEEVKFCICQMPMHEYSTQPCEKITYQSLDELDTETMKDFMAIR